MDSYFVDGFVSDPAIEFESVDTLVQFALQYVSHSTLLSRVLS